MTRSIPPSVAVALAIAAGACGGSAGPDAPAPAGAEATLTVENLGFPDVTIYAVSATGSRVRLGLVNGNSTQRLALPAYLVRGGESLRFLADPVGGARGPVSQELFVTPGETVVLTIPPS